MATIPYSKCRPGYVSISAGGEFLGEIKAENWKPVTVKTPVKPAPVFIDYVDPLGDGLATRYGRPQWHEALRRKGPPRRIVPVGDPPGVMEVSRETADHLMTEMQASLRGERPCKLQQQERQQMEEKTRTFYDRDLEPLRVQALIVRERHKHATNKFRHDRSTHDGSMVVDRPLFLKMLTALAHACGLTRVGPWNMAMLYSEIRHATELDNGDPQRVDSEEPKVRVPATCVIDLIEAYRVGLVKREGTRVPGEPTATYKRTTTKASEFDKPVKNSDAWSRRSTFRGLVIGSMNDIQLSATLAQVKKEAQAKWEEWDDEDWGEDSVSDTDWEDYLHPAYEALILRAHDLGLHSLVRKFKPRNPDHDNLTVTTSG